MYESVNPFLGAYFHIGRDFVVVQSPCCVWLFETPGYPVPHHLPEFAQVHVHCISYAIQPSHPLMLSSPSVLNLSHIRDFPNESSVCIR